MEYLDIYISKGIYISYRVYMIRIKNFNERNFKKQNK